MARNFDLALKNNDLLIQDGDFVITESDQQHIIDTINAFPGWWKEFPADGVGILRYLRSSGEEQRLCRDVKIQLTSDGYQVGNPKAVTVNERLTLDPDARKA